MLRLDLSPESLGRTRFGYSPLSEVASSVRVLQSAEPPRLLRTWARQTRSRLDPADAAHLAAIIPAPPNHFAPHFLFARSWSATESLEAQLEELRALPRDQVAADIRRAWRPLPPPVAAEELLRRRDLVDQVVALLCRYWLVALAPYWDRMSSVIQEDVEHRTSAIGSTGLTWVINDLHETVQLHGTELRVHKPYLDEALPAGQPVLIPAIFVWPRLAVIHDKYGRFDIIYGAQGVGRVWESVGALPETHPLCDLIGRGRARILWHLDIARTTTMLAAELGVSPGTVSQHLSILRRAGLVTPHRRGRAVYYHRTVLADSLIGERGSQS